MKRGRRTHVSIADDGDTMKEEGDTMKEMLVHCGFPKTGSTAFQQLLASNVDSLKSKGILYPRSGIPDLDPRWVEYGHHNIAYEIGDARGRFKSDAGSLDDLTAEVSASGCDRVIISSESMVEPLTLDPKRVISEIQGHFPDWRIIYVFCVRDFSSFYISDRIEGLRQWRLSQSYYECEYPWKTLDRIAEWYPTPILNAIEMAGAENVQFVPYGNNAVSDLLDLMNVPRFEEHKTNALVNLRPSGREIALLFLTAFHENSARYHALISDVNLGVFHRWKLQGDYFHEEPFSIMPDKFMTYLEGVSHRMSERYEFVPLSTARHPRLTILDVVDRLNDADRVFISNEFGTDLIENFRDAWNSARL